MRVGIDTFTIREMKLDPFATLDFTREHGLDGAQFGGIRSLSGTLDAGELREVRSHADSLGLYSHVSVPWCNPHKAEGTVAEHRAEVARQIEAAAACGWHELHTALAGFGDRVGGDVPWARQLEDSAQFIRDLAPVLREHGSRVNIETHGAVTTFEVVRIVEDVGPEVAGICLDTANLLCVVEDPVAGARRAAPYTHLTHTKDATAFFTEKGYRRQGRPPGEGALDWEAILPALGEHAPDLPLSIEDHKWFFDMDVFDPAWLRDYPDLTPEEFASVMKLVWTCEHRIMQGELMDPDEYEAIPLEDQLIERIHSGVGYLKGLLDRLGLAAS